MLRSRRYAILNKVAVTTGTVTIVPVAKRRAERSGTQ